jgi:hypothetical protein
MIGEAESCKSICHGVGWPSPAHATPALASKIPKISAVALNRDNTGIDLPDHGPFLRRRHRAATIYAYQIHVCRATVRLSCNGTV